MKSYSYTLALNTFDILTKTQKRIVISLLFFHRKYGKTIYPCYKTISSMSKCSSVYVKKFVSTKLYEKIEHVIKKENRRKNGRFDSNRYDLCPHFFETLKMLEELGFLANWKTHRQWILKEVMNNDDFLYEKYHKKRRLSTPKVSTVIPPKVSHIKDLKNYPRDSYSNNRVGAASEPTKMQLMLSAFPLKSHQREWIEENASIKGLGGAIFNYRWYEKQNPVYSPGDLLINLVKKQTQIHAKELAKTL